MLLLKPKQNPTKNYGTGLKKNLQNAAELETIKQWVLHKSRMYIYLIFHHKYTCTTKQSVLRMQGMNNQDESLHLPRIF